MELPPPLRAALEATLGDRSDAAHVSNVRRLSEAYRKGCRGLLDVRAAEAYLIGRLPATYAAIGEALAETAHNFPASPRSLIDAGAGPGTAAWAATWLWPDIEKVTLVDASRAMIDVGRRLASLSGSRPLSQAAWIHGDLTGRWEPSQTADLVIAAYSLGELAPRDLLAASRRLWDRSAELLVVVEPGTPKGYRTVQAVRAELIGRGAHTVAPCPHDLTCPLEAPDWCHFGARIARSASLRRAKAGVLPYEDEKFAYVALSPRLPDGPRWARVLRRPELRPGHVRLRLCRAEGVDDAITPRSQGAAYRAARKVRWGGSIRPDDRPPTEL